MDNTEIYYFDQEWLQGPASITEVAQMVAVGELDTTTPTWTQTGDEWIEAGFFAELAQQKDNATPHFTSPQAANILFKQLPPPREVFALRLAYDQHLITRQQADRCLREVMDSPKLAYDIPGRLHRLGWITAGQRSNLACLAQADDKREIIAGYEILEKLGSGGMGITYKARQLSLDRIVALKVLLPRYSQDQQYTKRFIREARLAAKLNHENIATVYEVGSSGNEYFMVMELVEGVTLAQMVQERGKIPETEAIGIIIKIASALQHAYEIGIVHRDISAKNIMIGKNGHPKLIDLGLAKNIDNYAKDSDDSGTAIGTPAYLSPEQALGRANVDVRSDIYSLGCVFYEILCGEPPFHGESALETIAMHLNRSIPDIPGRGVSPAVRMAVKKMTHRDLAQRYQTPAALLDDLQNVRIFADDDFSDAIPPVDEQLRHWEGERVEIVLQSDWREYLHVIAQEIDRRLKAEQVLPDFQGYVQTVYTELAANAFDHGIADDEDGRVFIRIEINKAFFRLEVEDTGAGFASKEVLKALRQAPPNRERQRGLLQVMQIADLLEYNKKGNRAKAVIYRKAAGCGVFVQQREDSHFAEVRGNGDMALTEEFRRWVDNYAPSPKNPLCLLVRTEWVCSMFVGSVAKLAGKMEENGARFVVWVERSGCRRIMEQLGVTSFVEIYSSFEKAVAALKSPRPQEI